MIDHKLISKPPKKLESLSSCEITFGILLTHTSISPYVIPINYHNEWCLMAVSNSTVPLAVVPVETHLWFGNSKGYRASLSTAVKALSSVVMRTVLKAKPCNQHFHSMVVTVVDSNGVLASHRIVDFRRLNLVYYLQKVGLFSNWQDLKGVNEVLWMRASLIPNVMSTQQKEKKV